MSNGPDSPIARHPSREASDRLGRGRWARVLEPSPPADATDPDYLADDPVAVDRDVAGTRTVVSPVRGADLTWEAAVTAEPSLAAFARDHWLAAHRPLRPLPSRFAETRLDLHRLAALVVSPARRRALGKMGLRMTHRGFGTPFFTTPEGMETQVRVEVGAEHVWLVVQEDGAVRFEPVSTLRAGATFVGGAPDTDWAAAQDIPEPGDLDATLRIDRDSAWALSDWYGFAWSILEELRAESASDEPSRPQLWPEHFDPALELGSAEREQRASYGFSPGDVAKNAEPGAIPLPYVYVGPWFPDARPASDYWNAGSFPGAVMSYADIVGDDDAREQRAAVLSFLRKGRSLLTRQG